MIALRWSIHVVSTRTLAPLGVSRKDICDDLLESCFISDEGPVDLRYSAWGARIGMPGVAELSGVKMQDRMRCE